MALSNWDCLALDEANQSTNGVFNSPLGVQVEIYKNWIYVRDKKAWEEGGGYTEPTIMEIQEGDLRYKDVNIFAKRGPQQGVFCVVYIPSYRHPEEKDVFMVGAGVYGFEGEEFVGVDQFSRDFLKNMIKDNAEEFPEAVRKLNFSDALRFNQGDAYFAVQLGHEVPATEVGKAESTIMSHLIEGMKEGDKSD